MAISKEYSISGYLCLKINLIKKVLQKIMKLSLFINEKNGNIINIQIKKIHFIKIKDKRKILRYNRIYFQKCKFFDKHYSYYY